MSSAQKAQAKLTNATVRLKELQTERLAVADNRAAVRAAASIQANRINLITAQRRLS